jgi:hypothetical protein
VDELEPAEIAGTSSTPAGRRNVPTIAGVFVLVGGRGSARPRDMEFDIRCELLDGADKDPDGCSCCCSSL